MSENQMSLGQKLPVMLTLINLYVASYVKTKPDIAMIHDAITGQIKDYFALRGFFNRVVSK